MNAVAWSQPILALGAALGAALACASGVGWWLARRAGANAVSPAVRNLNQRVGAWWVMCLGLGIALSLGAGAVTALFAVIAWFAWREYLAIAPTTPADHRALASIAYIGIPAQFALVPWAPAPWFSFVGGLFAVALLPTLVATGGDANGFGRRATTLAWGFVVCVWSLAHIPALAYLASDRLAATSLGALGLIIFLLLTTQGSDVLQYLWGKAFGRRPIAPTISPNKTVEGFAGGVASVALLGAGLAWLTPFEPLVAGALALLNAIVGFGGGLVMSALKRDAGVKDFGQLLPGHGGMLDRVDSLTFSAPVFYYCITMALTSAASAP